MTPKPPLSPKVAILMGSSSDLESMRESAKILKDFGVDYEISVLSAHRSPKLLLEYLQKKESEIHVFIIGAGSAAHLAGVVASNSLKPVIGIPLDSSPLKGIDSLYSTVQMPSGVPVATMSIGKAGIKNASLYALRILALQDKGIREKLQQYQKNLAQEIQKTNQELQQEQ